MELIQGGEIQIPNCSGTVLEEQFLRDTGTIDAILIIFSLYWFDSKTLRLIVWSPPGLMLPRQVTI